MKVKSKLQINTIISFSIISLIILMVLLIHQQEGKELLKGKLAGEIVKGTFELNILTNGLLVHNEERAQEQWELKYNSLNKLLTETKFENRETQDALDNIQKRFEKIKLAFNKLVDIKQRRRVLSHDQIAISQELEERLISQMSMNSQSMVTYAYQLDKASTQVVEISRGRVGLLTLSFVVVIIISVGVAFFFFNKQIVKPIEKLQKGIHAVAGGNLDHKVGISSNDEIGHLSTDFDLMTEKLKTITVSKDKLAKEIAIRKQTENRNKSLAYILEESLNEIYIFDAKTLRFIQVNKGARLNLGYSMEELSNFTPLDLKPELTDESFEKMVEPLRVGERQIIQFTTVHRRRDGSLYDVEVHLQLSTLQSVSAFVAIILDITERKQAEEEIKSLAKFPSENPNPVIRVEKNGSILYTNNAGTILLDHWGTQSDQSLPEDWHKHVLDVLRSGTSKDYEIKCNDHIFSITLAPVVEEGYVNLYGLDITERKMTEAQIKASLKEKEVLLKEIHHRVKNNMQVMASLLRLQSEEIKDKHLLDLFNESQNRIKSMALIHEDLYQGKDLARIDFDQYTRKLTGRLMKSFGVDPNRIITSVNIDNVFLGVDKAIPCGLIINELFTNSLKYAFPHIITDVEHIHEKGEDRERSKNKGEICINFRSNSDAYTLVFSDNGVGFPEDIDFHKTETMGLDIVKTLVEQLKGTIESNRNSGTEFTITFRT